MLSYNDVRKLSPVTAREKVIESLQHHTPSEIAKLFKMSRTTIYNIMARYEKHGIDGLADFSRRPYHPANQTSAFIEKVVVFERARTGFGPRRMKLHLERNHEQILPESTLRNIFRRNRLTKKTKRRKQARAINLEPLYPLQRFQIDLKHILDFQTLPTAAYDHVVHKGLPVYQWTAIDLKTRMRFLAYSYEKTAANGLLFMQITALWIRAFGIHHPLQFQTDWGEEFGGKSPRKLAQWQQDYFDPLGVLRSHIRKGHSEDNAYVERSHRTDDEEFYIPWLTRCSHTENFLYRAFHFLYTYNTARPHQGKNMHNMTPWGKLKSLCHEIQPGIAAFPPLLLDDIPPLKPLDDHLLKPSKSVQYVQAPYQNSGNLWIGRDILVGRGRDERYSAQIRLPDRLGRVGVKAAHVVLDNYRFSFAFYPYQPLHGYWD